MDEVDKHIKELFKELVKHVDSPLINDPIDIYEYTELEKHIQDGWTLFLVKEEPILAYLNESGNLFYYTRKQSLLSILKKRGNTVVLPKEEYSLRLLHVIVLTLNGMTLSHRPYDRYRSDFLDKIFYFLEIPIDGYVLSQYNIYPDIEATRISDLVPNKCEPCPQD